MKKPRPPHIGALARRTLAITALLTVAGCAATRPAPVEEMPSTMQAETAPLEGEASASSPVAAPGIPDRVPAPSPHQVVVLFANDVPGHTDVAAQIAELLPVDTYRVSLVDIRAAESATAVEALQDRAELVTVAVGLGAVEFARARLGERPIVFCQVFNYPDLLRGNESIWGVHSIPPLALQLQAWKSVDASLRRIGLIVSEAHMQWLEDAHEAAARAGIEIRTEVSASDRETLYLFKRLTPQIDGFWLLPDNTILSPAVLEEMLRYALSHDVGVLVFNERLLDWGALMSVSGTTANIAQTVRDIVARVVTGRTEGLPAMTPLSEVSLQVNTGVTTRLGKQVLPGSSWVLRESD
jgi:putative tryptophan/tyrosine transport system substrate-binding protein